MGLGLGLTKLLPRRATERWRHPEFRDNPPPPTPMLRRPPLPPLLRAEPLPASMKSSWFASGLGLGLGVGLGLEP